jgi:DNA-binding MarR family transcriptional regulator
MASAPDVEGSGLDALIHPLPRLSICASLAGVEWAVFAVVRDEAGLSDSALSKHARVLEDAGYVALRKGAVGRRPRTWLRLTDEGRAAFARHMAALAVMTDAPTRATEPAEV